jgi:hypothetical protein
VFLGNRKPVRRAVSEFWRVESIVPMVFKAALSILVHIRADIAWRLEALDRSDESALICLKGRLPTRRSTSLPISVSTQVHPGPFKSTSSHKNTRAIQISANHNVRTVRTDRKEHLYYFARHKTARNPGNLASMGIEP